MSDITERKRAEEALLKSEERYRGVFAAIPDGALVHDAEGVILDANEALARRLEVPREALTGSNIAEFVAPENAVHITANAEEALMGKTLLFDTTYISASGRTTPAEVHERSLPWGADDSVLLSISRDITERKEAEEALKKVRDDYQTITNLTGDIIVQSDKEGRWTFLNDQACEFWGKPREELIGSLFSDYLHLNDQEETSANILEMVRSGDTAKGLVNRQRTPQGRRIVQWNGAPIYRDGEYTGFQATGRDITHQKQAEEERDKLQARLSQAHKMEAIGTLAGGIAHDFNNILSVIVGNAELAMLDVPEWNAAHDNLKEVREASLRARELVKQILLFARQKEHTVSNIHLEPIVKESLKMLRASIPATVQIRKNIREGLPSVLADPSQIQQIIMNLCTNAGQVMEAEGGTLTFTLDIADLETPLHNVMEALPPGRYVSMQVRDTGPGIPLENLGKIFDPFFTTKGVGEGTGLGLAVVHGIVQDRKGGITVQSEPGRGTTFAIYLPASDVPSTEVTAEQKWELPRGTERVLFVDDEAMILDLGQRMLERLGYKVETRASGTDALECYRQDPNRFDLVVTDMTMPGMRGDRLAEEILAIRPDIPVILCTGYSRQISKEKAREIGIRAFVMKPLTQHELANTVRRVLDEKPRK